MTEIANAKPETVALLTMLRREYRYAVPSPTKRPRGGRANPVLSHREPRHGAAIARERGSRPILTMHRDQGLGVVGRLVAAVSEGSLPVGTEMRGVDLRRVVGKNYAGGWEDVAVALAHQKSPVRLLVLSRGNGKNARYRIELR
jgi:hypothetical protein